MEMDVLVDSVLKQIVGDDSNIKNQASTLSCFMSIYKVSYEGTLRSGSVSRS